MSSGHHHLDRNSGHEEAAATTQAPATSVNPVEPQDTHAAGAATGKQKELLQDNVSGTSHKGAHEASKELKDQSAGDSAGVHSTGSYTGTSGGK